MGDVLGAIVGTIRAGIGAAEAVKQKRRQENLIQQAYERGHGRLNIEQLDTRQGVAEGNVQRGLAGGGGVRVGGPAPSSDETRTWLGDRWGAPTPYSVAGGTDLGSQAGLDLGREQRLQQDELVAQRESALQDVRGAYSQAVIGSAAAGIQTGTTVAGWGKTGEAGGGTTSALPTGRPAGDVIPPPSGGAVAAAYGAPTEAAAGGYTNAWGGIHPTQPWGVGGGSARQGDGTNASFNVVGGG